MILAVTGAGDLACIVADALTFLPVTNCRDHRLRGGRKVPGIRAVRLNTGQTVRFTSVVEARWAADTLVIRGDVDRPGNTRTVSLPVWNIREILVDGGAARSIPAAALGWGVGAVAGFFGTFIALCNLVRCFG